MSKLNEFLIFYTDYLNLIVEVNNKVKNYEDLGIETPKEIKNILYHTNITANFLLIGSECITITQSFNLNSIFLYKIFYIKSIYRIVNETFNLFNKYGKYIFGDAENKILKITPTELIEKINVFKANYNLDEIRRIRNKLSSHYTDDFIEHINLTTNLDVEKSIKMFHDFTEILVGYNSFIINKKLPIAVLKNILLDYFKYIDLELKKRQNI